MGGDEFRKRLSVADAALSRLARIPPQPWWTNILIGLAFAAGSLTLRWALSGFYGQISGFIILLPGVVLAGLAAGRLAGVTTVIASLLGGWVIAGPSATGVGISTPIGVVATTNFIVVGVFVAVVAASLRKSMARLDRTVADLSAADARIGESDARFRLMADTAPSPVWMTNAKVGSPGTELEFAL